RVAGRIMTVHDPAAPLAIELGAEYVPGPGSESWRLVESAGAAAYEAVGERLVTGRGGTGELVHEGGGLEWLDTLLAEFDPATLPDRSLGEFLAGAGLPAGAEAEFRRFVEGYHAAPVDQVGLHWLL